MRNRLYNHCRNGSPFASHISYCSNPATGSSHTRGELLDSKKRTRNCTTKNKLHWHETKQHQPATEKMVLLITVVVFILKTLPHHASPRHLFHHFPLSQEEDLDAAPWPKPSRSRLPGCEEVRQSWTKDDEGVTVGPALHITKHTLTLALWKFPGSFTFADPQPHSGPRILPRLPKLVEWIWTTKHAKAPKITWTEQSLASQQAFFTALHAPLSHYANSGAWHYAESQSAMLAAASSPPPLQTSKMQSAKSLASNVFFDPKCFSQMPRAISFSDLLHVDAVDSRDAKGGVSTILAFRKGAASLDPPRLSHSPACNVALCTRSKLMTFWWNVFKLYFSQERLRRVLRKEAAVVIHLHSLTSADLHLHTFTSADLHLHSLTSADLHLHSSHLLIYIFTPSHLLIYIFTPSHLLIYIFTPSHLLIYIFTPSHLLIYIFTPSHLLIYIFTPSHLLIYIFTPPHLQIYIFTPSHLQIYFLAPSHLRIFSPFSFYLSLSL